MPLEYTEAFAAVDAAYGGLDAALADLADDDLLRPTRCLGWCGADLVYHLLLDVQRALVALATPTDAPAGADFVGYWREAATDPETAAAHARYVRRAASAYERPATVVRHWRDTAQAAVRAARAAPAGGRVETQDVVLRVPDLLATLAVEAAVHHLDLAGVVRAGPGAVPLALVRRTLDGLLGAPVPEWDDETYALKGAGRAPLTPRERAHFGPLADRFPLLG